ncbi:MAG: DUF1318 domain-containing protein [Candidatus Omnitrophota bacterium]
MKIIISLFIVSIVMIGCAKVNLQTAKPLQVDINMRVDVYQHVAKDVESIQDQIYGTAKEKQMNAILFIEAVYAQESSSGLSSAIERRRVRKDTITEYFKKEYIGENKNADLEIVSKNMPADEQSKVQEALRAENQDRDTIYQATATKNGVGIQEVRKMFFDDDYKRAPGGSWFEVYSGNSYSWQKK